MQNFQINISIGFFFLKYENYGIGTRCCGANTINLKHANLIYTLYLYCVSTCYNL